MEAPTYTQHSKAVYSFLEAIKIPYDTYDGVQSFDVTLNGDAEGSGTTVIRFEGGQTLILPF